MKEKNRKILFGIVIGLVAILVIVILGMCMKGKQIKTNKFGKYSADIIIETKKTDGEEKKRKVSYKDDGKTILARADYLDGAVYIQGKKIYTSNGGRYQKTTRNLSYNTLYNIIYSLDFPKEDGNYNPRFEAEIANRILDSLFIDSSVSKDVYANVSFSDGRLQKFSIYLSNIVNFEKLNISIVFGKLEENFENNLPKFYDEVTDEMNLFDLMIDD